MAVQNLFVSMLLGIPIGLVLAIPITPFVGLLRIMLLSPSKREKLRAQAEAKGHVVEAEMEKSYDDIRYDKVTGDQLPSNSIIGVYKYYVNGKKYKCKLSSTSRLSEKITLYYIKKPRHATTAGHLGNEELPWGKLYILATAVLTIIFVIIGTMSGLSFWTDFPKSVESLLRHGFRLDIGCVPVPAYIGIAAVLAVIVTCIKKR